jgi:hypothetical protein
MVSVRSGCLTCSLSPVTCDLSVGAHPARQRQQGSQRCQQRTVVPIEFQLAIQSTQQIRGIGRIEESINLTVRKMAGKFPGEIADHQLVAKVDRQ